MTSAKRTRISRRSVLRGTGVALALPALECMASHQGFSTEQAGPQRMIAINFELSFHPPNLIPSTSGSEYQLTPYLQPLEDIRDKFTVISGTSHPDVDGGHAASVSWLTGAAHPGAANFENSISIDQLAAQSIGLETRFASRQMGTGIAISSNGVKVPGSPYPAKHFAEMFLEGRADEKTEQIRRLREGQSILDVVQESSKRMQRRVSKRDKAKLEEYFNSVREAERSLHKSEQWHNKPKPTVDAKAPIPVRNRAQIIEHAKQFYDIMFLALQTDSTRLMTYVVGDGTQTPLLPGVSQNYHNLSHHGRDPEKLRQLAIVESEYVKLLGDFIRRLQSTSENESNLLERTMILFGSHMHSGNHNNQNLPVVLAGGRFRHGRHIAMDQHNNTPLANLYVTMLQNLGLEIDRFSSSTGTFSELTK